MGGVEIIRIKAVLSSTGLGLQLELSLAKFLMWAPSYRPRRQLTVEKRFVNLIKIGVTTCNCNLTIRVLLLKMADHNWLLTPEGALLAYIRTDPWHY